MKAEITGFFKAYNIALLVLLSGLTVTGSLVLSVYMPCAMFSDKKADVYIEYGSGISKTAKSLKAAGVNMQEPQVPGAGKLAGMIFLFTGELVRHTRREAGARVRALGGEVGLSVTQATAYVVAGEAAGSKLAKARAMGVRIINEQEFEELTA